MIFNTSRKDTLFSILKALEDYNQTFYPTGSRFLGIQKKTSDYDFFTTDNNAARQFVVSKGFTLLWEKDEFGYPTNYTEEDSLQELVGIVRHKYLPIDIQFVYDAKKKQKIQEAIKSQLFMAWRMKLPKKYNKILWETAYAAYNKKNATYLDF